MFNLPAWTCTVAYYALQHLKSGRRSVGYSSVDALASATQLNGRSTVCSIHEEVPMDSETDETVPVSELAWEHG